MITNIDRTQQMKEKDEIREQIRRRNQQHQRQQFKAITGFYPYNEDYRFFNEGRNGGF